MNAPHLYPITRISVCSKESDQLISVGVNPQIAEVDACRMEHAVSDESFQKLKEHAMREIASQKIDNTFDDFPVKK